TRRDRIRQPNLLEHLQRRPMYPHQVALLQRHIPPALEPRPHRRLRQRRRPQRPPRRPSTPPPPLVSLAPTTLPPTHLDCPPAHTPRLSPPRKRGSRAADVW